VHCLDGFDVRIEARKIVRCCERNWGQAPETRMRVPC